eukprot:TRINITY_DN9788_c0_g1_i1.p1 TRINITY_DN9788_c0_g1~~TRINITY_DN9788_c0_g1_i1.p1  ORF type:complete len:492 (-),score=67.04 TRINITY_DN9788_c0_g1_i1:16-1491(-)
MRFLGVVVFLLVVSVVGAKLADIRASSKHNFLLDSHNRVRIFHGVNVVRQTPPWFNTAERGLLSDAAVENLKEWGFNIVRLGVMWVGIEPSPGVWDDFILNLTRTYIARLADADIYTLLDCHQDDFAPKFCGDGLPDWLVHDSDALPFAEPIHPKIENHTECSKYNYFTYYFSDAVSQTFQNLYDNEYGMQTAFIKYWRKIASEFTNSEGVIGFELINEPWIGDFYSNPLLAIPGIADIWNLQPMYDKLAAAIREEDHGKHLIFYEPEVNLDVGPAGFTHVPGGSSHKNESVLAYHLYCAPAEAKKWPLWEEFLCDDVYLGDYFLQRSLDVERLGGASLITEFGFCDAMTPAGSQLCEFILNGADDNLVGWAYWDANYNAFYENGSVSGPVNYKNVKMFSRTYAQAIAGIPTDMTFDSTTGDFALIFTPNVTITQPTEIYINEKFYYPHGLDVIVDPPQTLTVQRKHNRVFLSNTNFQGSVSVRIRPLSGN